MLLNMAVPQSAGIGIGQKELKVGVWLSVCGGFDTIVCCALFHYVYVLDAIYPRGCYSENASYCSQSEEGLNLPCFISSAICCPELVNWLDPSL